MKLTFKKGYDGDVGKPPVRTVEGAVAFREPETIEKLSVIANTLALIITIPLLVAVFFIHGGVRAFSGNFDRFLLHLVIASVAMLISMPVHEILHAICFRENVEFYTYLRKGLMFVIGTESMTKRRFIFMSLLPNVVFGLIPFVLFIFFPSALWLGLFGATSLGAGAGDYINVFHAATQMPRGALCYMSSNRSYWYMPK